jgi:hypothetical protein
MLAFRSAVIRSRRLLCAFSIAGFVACGGDSIDRTKFERLILAGSDVRADLSAGPGVGSTRLPSLLSQFKAEISALDGRMSGRREVAALKAFAAASETYGYLLRFRELDSEAVQGMVLLRGANRPLASRYKLPMVSRGGARWVDRKTAMKMFADEAEAELTKANRLIADDRLYR